MNDRAAIAALVLAALLPLGRADAALISYWSGDGNADDSVGPNSGTLVNGASFAPGKIGQAFSFDGTSYLEAPSIGLPTGGQDRSIDLWFQVNSYSDTVEEAFLAGYGAFGFFDQSYALGVVHFNISGPQDDNVFFSQWGTGVSGPTIEPGTWHNVAVTSSGDFATLYLDGVVVGTGTVPIDTAAGSTFYMGRIPGELGDIRQLDGFVDEVRVYDSVLSASEIQLLAGVPEPTTALLVMTGVLGLAARRNSGSASGRADGSAIAEPPTPG
jgi:hypothetical protein